jgi:pimeloyl-ACP methyl ester carboxylesterase
MAVIVLVHGGWSGGWVWKGVASRLRAAGHEVFTPTMTGLGARSHLASPNVDLDTHIDDVVGVLEWEELENVVLCGHRYGGWVIPGAADRAAERIAAIVYLDAFLPRDGEALFDLIPDWRREAFLAGAQASDGWRVPPLSAAEWGVTDPEEQNWLDRLSVPHPLATFRQPIGLTGAAERITARTYVRATKYDPSPFQKFAAALKDDPGWRSRTLPCHHMVNVSMADEVAQILIEAA